MICPTCGKETQGTAAFCVFCGSRLLIVPTPAPASEVLYLRCREGDLAGKKFALTRQGLILGRDPSCPIAVNNAEVSRRHVWIGLDEANRPLVIDQGSANGTFVNEQRVTRAILNAGDTLSVGITNRIIFGLEMPEPPARPKPEPVAVSVPPAVSPVAPRPHVPAPEPVPPPAMANRTIAEAAHFKVSKPRLQLIVDHYVVESYAISSQGVCIGRDPSNCTILLDHPSISRVHARVVQKGGMALLVDEGSANGTFANGKRINEHVLSEGDVITFGVYNEKSLIFRDFKAGHMISRTLKLDRDTVTIGRDPGNDMVLDHPMVSNFHARMVRSASGYVLSDLGSLNGTFVNGRKVTTQALSPRDRIVIGGFELKFDGQQVQHQSQASGLSIDAYSIEKRVAGNLVLLDDISLCIQPNEFVGLLGPSGAGKSTLMDALNGFRPATSGSVVVNGLDLYASYESLKSMIGYVPQDDIIHRQLSVYKCLYYAAKLRLPSDTPESEIEKIINEVLKTLELEERRHTLITKLSGGQRKRVNIGVELVTKPTLLFLDEPTSGLDPRTEAKMMALFRQLADQGRTVLLTTHVMASLSQLDKIIVLVKGKLAYFGPGADITDYFGVESPGDIFDKLETASPQEWKERYLNSPQYSEYITQPLAIKEKSAAAAPAMEKPASKKKISSDQFIIQTKRYAEIKFNDIVFTSILLIQAPLLAGLDVLVTSGDRLLFLVIFGAIWYGFTNATREIVGEQPIYKRERQTGLKIPSYIFSKVLVLSVIALAQCLLTVGTVSIFGKLESNFFIALFIMFITSVNGVLLGLLVSAAVHSTELAITFGVVALFPQIILAGLLVPIHTISQYREFEVTARQAAKLAGKPEPEGATGDVVVAKERRMVSELKGLDAPVRAVSTVIVTRWGLEALADVTRKEDQIPPNYEVLVAVKNSYQECIGWLFVIGLFVLATLLFVQKRKDFKQ